MDQQTIDRAKVGDRVALESLLRELQDPWFRFCLSLLRDPEAARDASQETAVRFLSRLNQFRGESSLITWSMGIAINVVREMRRVRQTKDLDEAFARESAANSPGEDAHRGEMQSALASLLDDLPQRQREAIVLRYFQELSIEETATVMQCAPGTIKATIHQALRKLREKLSEFA